MKVIERLEGKMLSRDQQKQITGGSRLVCVCNDGTGFICVGNALACGVDAIQTCAAAGGGGSCMGQL
jgi:hypothetical protein